MKEYFPKTPKIYETKKQRHKRINNGLETRVMLRRVSVEYVKNNKSGGYQMLRDLDHGNI